MLISIFLKHNGILLVARCLLFISFAIIGMKARHSGSPIYGINSYIFLIGLLMPIFIYYYVHICNHWYESRPSGSPICGTNSYIFR